MTAKRAVKPPGDASPGFGGMFRHWCTTALAKRNRSAWQNLFTFIGSVVATAFISHEMLKLSGTALWLPGAWRVSVEALGMMLGLWAFHHALHASAPEHPVAATSGAAAGENAQPHAATPTLDYGTRPAARASIIAALLRCQPFLLCMGIAVITLILYMLMRQACVIAWDPRDWLAQERAMNPVVHEPGNTAAKEQAASTPVSAHDDPAPAEESAHGDEKRVNDSDRFDIPDFVDLKHHELYVPWRFPRPERDYLDHLRERTGQDGLTVALHEEPDLVLDWLRGPWRYALWESDAIFGVLFLLFIYSFASAAGYSYSVVEVVVAPAMH